MLSSRFKWQQHSHSKHFERTSSEHVRLLGTKCFWQCPTDWLLQGDKAVLCTSMFQNCIKRKSFVKSYRLRRNSMKYRPQIYATLQRVRRVLVSCSVSSAALSLISRFNTWHVVTLHWQTQSVISILLTEAHHALHSKPHFPYQQFSRQPNQLPAITLQLKHKTRLYNWKFVLILRC